jgi:hypothetical protein
MEALLAGQARVALIDATAFYTLGEGVFPQPRGGAEGLGVAGYDMAHILVRQDGEVGVIADVSRLGVGQTGGNSERAAHMILSALGLNEDVELVGTEAPGEEAVDAQVALLQDGELDAVLLMAAVDHPKITEIMNGDRLQLLPLPEWQEGNHLIRFPFLRVARIPAGTYAGQSEPVDTAGAQVVLAGPTASADPIGTAGPGSAAIGEVLPLTDKTVVSLNENLETEELLDPAVPSSAILRPQPRAAPASVTPSPAHSVVNFLVICVIIYLLYLYFRRGPVRRRQATDGRTAEERRAA